MARHLSVCIGGKGENRKLFPLVGELAVERQFHNQGIMLPIKWHTRCT